MREVLCGVLPNSGAARHYTRCLQVLGERTYSVYPGYLHPV
jgi:hypothetical protein